MQWQHGSFTFNPSNGSLVLTPIAVDGRQLLSSPCEGSNSIYTRYNQTELFEVSNHTQHQSASYMLTICFLSATNTS